MSSTGRPSAVPPTTRTLRVISQTDQSQGAPPSEASTYESPKLVGEYLLFHYGSAEEVLGDLPGPRDAVNFAARLVNELLDTATLPSDATALDLGCAVGGSTFELARRCHHVRGLDFSHAFIAAAQTLARDGTVDYSITVEGTITEPRTCRRPDGVDAARTEFAHGDACHLPLDLGPFDVVLAANLLCRLPDPAKFLQRLPGLVRPGGQFLITTPFTWMAEFTPTENWVGATPAAGRSFDALREILAPHFDLTHQVELPFLIREHSRKFQYTVALGSRWVRR